LRVITEIRKAAGVGHALAGVIGPDEIWIAAQKGIICVVSSTVLGQASRPVIVSGTRARGNGAGRVKPRERVRVPYPICDRY
jgi:hypothetical protein